MKKLVLGTALWGWGVDKATALRMVDSYVAGGGKYIDTASNYPINAVPEDFGKAANWLAEWIRINGPEKLSVWLKIGSINNLGNPDLDLRPAAIREAELRFKDLFGEHLHTIAVHWDNRGEEQASDIYETVTELVSLKDKGYSVGFSGVASPSVYYDAAPDMAKEWHIQVKENALTRSARQTYSRYFPNANYYAYGINMGGVKGLSSTPGSSADLRRIAPPEELIRRIEENLDSSLMDPHPSSLVEFSLAFAMLNPGLTGIVIGPRNLDQLDHTLSFCRTVSASAEEYERVCAKLKLYS